MLCLVEGIKTNHQDVSGEIQTYTVLTVFLTTNRHLYELIYRTTTI